MKWLALMFGLWLVAVVTNNYIKQADLCSKPDTFQNSKSFSK